MSEAFRDTRTGMFIELTFVKYVLELIHMYIVVTIVGSERVLSMHVSCVPPMEDHYPEQLKPRYNVLLCECPICNLKPILSACTRHKFCPLNILISPIPICS